MLPAEWRKVLQQFGIDDLAVSSDGIDRPLDIDRVPEHDGCCDQGKAAGTIALLLETAVPYFSEPAEEDCSGQGIARFAFIEADLNAAAQLDALQPGQDKQGPFDAAQLSQSDRKPILPGVAAKLSQHERSCYRALLDRSGEAEDFAPVRPDRFEIERASDHGLERLVFDFAFGNIELRVSKVSDAWSEAEPQQVHESEDMIGEAGGVGVVLFDPQIGLVMQQAIDVVLLIIWHIFLLIIWHTHTCGRSFRHSASIA